MSHFPQRLRLDLPDAFARDAKLLPDFFERARIAVADAKAQFQHLSFAFRQAAQHIAHAIFQQTETRHVQRIVRRLVLDKITEARVIAIAHRRLQ